jgi:hypothetical protein
MREGRLPRLPSWAPAAALGVTLVFAWLNFVTTGRWAALAGALHGWKKPWYAAALVAATALFVLGRRRVGRPIALPRGLAAAALAPASC